MMNLARSTTLALVALALAIITLAGPEPSHAAESPALSAARDRIHVRRCHRNGPPTIVCRALVDATHRVPVPRRWASSPALAELLRRESTWNPAAGLTCPRNTYHPRSCSPKGSPGATRPCGLFQLLPCRCWTPLVTQATCGLRYIRSRYGSPGAALAHSDRVGWY